MGRLAHFFYSILFAVIFLQPVYADTFFDAPFALNYATKTDMQAATSTTTVVNPAQMQNHPGVAKGWASVTGATAAILSSYNIASVTRTALGSFTITFTTPMATANYVVGAAQIPDIGGFGNIQQRSFDVVSTATTNYKLIFYLYTGTTNTKTAIDPTTFYTWALGTQ